MIKMVDCVMLKVADLESALAFYSDRLGDAVVWRTPEAVGLAMSESDSELVLHTRLEPQIDLLVANVQDAAEAFIAAGGQCVAKPFDVAIGRCAVVQDPFGNTLVLIDQTKGKLVTDAERRVVGVAPR